MKLFSLMIIGALSITACGGSKPKTETTEQKKDDTTTTNAEGTPCAQEIAMVCPEGQIDGCLKTPAEGETHKCVAK